MQSSPAEFGRQELLAQVAASDRILEIGPFTRPLLRGPNVKYFDVLDRAGLIARAAEQRYETNAAVPEIDFVSAVGDLSVVGEQFSACLSSHNIEHQPDLVEHLNQVMRLLVAGGRFLLIIPDKRYCFDHFIPESSIAEVLDGIGRRVHTLCNVVRHRAMVTHNDALRHWAGDHGYPRGIDNLTFVERALSEHKAAAGAYVDVHAWQFTPASFFNLMTTLNRLDLVSLKCERVYPTPYGRYEFCAILRKH